MTKPVPYLSFQGVTRRFAMQENPAVDDVSLDIHEGEITALIGESGSGKTTLLRLAAGLESPDRGCIILHGECVAGPRPIDPVVPPEKRRLGLVFQDGALFPHLDARRNVAYGLDGKDKSTRARRVEACLELVGLSGFGGRFPHELSGGERQRLGLARAIAPEPRLLLLDEPFSHLDPALRRRLRSEIHDILRQIGQTAMMVTHDPEDALAIASTVAILDQGKISQTGSPSDVYLHPVNQYCAERFGPANRVIDGLTGVVTWRRPEEARWISCEIADEGFPVLVESVRPLGHVHEVWVREGTTGASWLCFLKEARGITEGTHGRIAWRGAPDPVSWKS